MILLGHSCDSDMKMDVTVKARFSAWTDRAPVPDVKVFCVKSQGSGQSESHLIRPRGQCGDTEKFVFAVPKNFPAAAAHASDAVSGADTRLRICSGTAETGDSELLVGIGEECGSEVIPK